MVTGPLLLKPAIVSLNICPVESFSNLVAPMAKEFSKMAEGVSIEPQFLIPSFPAETTTKTPEALRLFIAISIKLQLLESQPSCTGQLQLLLITSGDKLGFGFKLLISVGAKNHS